MVCERSSLGMSGASAPRVADEGRLPKNDPCRADNERFFFLRNLFLRFPDLPLKSTILAL